MNQALLSWIQTEFADGRYSGSEYAVDCPFCGDTKKHLYISLAKPVAICFRCGWKGTHFELVKHYLDCDGAAEVFELIRGKPVSVSEFDVIRQRLVNGEIPAGDVLEEMPEWYIPFSESGGYDKHAEMVLNYALKRMSWQKVVRYAIGCCDDLKQEKFRMRMIIPIERGYFQARTIGKAEPKYTNPKEKVGDRVFNPTALTGKRLLVAEGAISAMALGEKAIAVLGKNVRQEQLQRIGDSKARKVIISFDADATWCDSAVRAAKYLTSVGKNVFIRKYAEGDPDTCDLYVDEEFSLSSQLAARWDMPRDVK